MNQARQRQSHQTQTRSLPRRGGGQSPTAETVGVRSAAIRTSRGMMVSCWGVERLRFMQVLNQRAGACRLATWAPGRGDLHRFKFLLRQATACTPQWCEGHFWTSCCNHFPRTDRGGAMHSFQPFSIRISVRRLQAASLVNWPSSEQSLWRGQLRHLAALFGRSLPFFRVLTERSLHGRCRPEDDSEKRTDCSPESGKR